MKIRYLIPFFIIFACSSSEEINVPKDIISKQEMILIFKDIHIADAMAGEKKIKDVKLSNQLKKTYLVGVLKKHKISKEEFERSFSYYENHVNLLFEVYNEVMIQLSEQEAELKGEKKDLKKDKK